jgi:ABC-2 type transport system ATP-binding protein
VASVDLVSEADGEAVLHVGRRADLAQLVALAGRDTELISFAYQPPTLSELFRQAVAA